MIVYRNTDVDAPFFWSSDRQPAARWHGDGEGPVQYLSTSPDAAWAEFLRHAGITDPADLAGIERTMWTFEIDDAEPSTEARLDVATMTGGLASYPECQAEARRLRRTGATRIVAPSAAKEPGSPSGWLSDPDLRPGPSDVEETVLLVGARPGQLGQMAAPVARPHASLLPFVRPL
jgi:hypothetical protein